MTSYRCPKCSIDHRMYDPPIEVIHSDLFTPADEEPETFAAQDDDIPFEDDPNDY